MVAASRPEEKKYISFELLLFCSSRQMCTAHRQKSVDSPPHDVDYFYQGDMFEVASDLRPMSLSFKEFM